MARPADSPDMPRVSPARRRRSSPSLLHSLRRRAGGASNRPDGGPSDSTRPRRRRGRRGPRFSAVSAASAVEYFNSLLSNGLHRRRKMRFCAVAAPSCAAFAPSCAANLFSACRSCRFSGSIRWGDAAVLLLDERSQSRVEDRASVIDFGPIGSFVHGDRDDPALSVAEELDTDPDRQ